MVTSGIKERAGRAIDWSAHVSVLFAARELATKKSFRSAVVSGSFEFEEISVAGDLCISYYLGTYGVNQELEL